MLRKREDGFDILGQPEGIERLGGVDVDQAVFTHVLNSLGGAAQTLDQNDPAVVAAFARLRRECVDAKEALSADTDVSVPVEPARARDRGAAHPRGARVHGAPGAGGDGDRPATGVAVRRRRSRARVGGAARRRVVAHPVGGAARRRRARSPHRRRREPQGHRRPGRGGGRRAGGRRSLAGVGDAAADRGPGRGGGPDPAGGTDGGRARLGDHARARRGAARRCAATGCAAAGEAAEPDRPRRRTGRVRRAGRRRRLPDPGRRRGRRRRRRRRRDDTDRRGRGPDDDARRRRHDDHRGRDPDHHGAASGDLHAGGPGGVRLRVRRRPGRWSRGPRAAVQLLHGRLRGHRAVRGLRGVRPHAVRSPRRSSTAWTRATTRSRSRRRRWSRSTVAGCGDRTTARRTTSGRWCSRPARRAATPAAAVETGGVRVRLRHAPRPVRRRRPRAARPAPPRRPRDRAGRGAGGGARLRLRAACTPRSRSRRRRRRRTSTTTTSRSRAPAGSRRRSRASARATSPTACA